jgi:uncharacterized protein (DUF305 family)
MEKKMSGNFSLKTKLKKLCISGLLVVAPFVSQAQTPGIVVKAIHFEHENLMRPMHDMMNKIYAIKMSGDFDTDYSAIMREFQQGGISLSKVYQFSGEDSKLLENARVNAVQLKEEQRLLKGCVLKGTKTTSATKEPNDMMSVLNFMMKRMEQYGQSGNLDYDYAVIMNTYDWANSELAKAELRHGQNDELKNRSAEIVEGSYCRNNTLTEWADKTVAEK